MEKRTPVELPRVTLAGREYFRDDRLREFRSVYDPSDVITFSSLRDFCARLGDVIRDEEGAGPLYDSLTAIAPTREIRSTLSRITSDERRHLELLRKLSDDYCVASGIMLL